ncbi:MAG TPA: 2-C-methyl-D-erythritol 4-phosphate cytidylyltransferase [Chloroflexota bacterium]
MTGKVGLVIVAAGSSARMRGVDKIWEKLGDRPVLWYSLSRLAPGAAECVVVVRAESLRRARDELEAQFPRTSVVAGGETRQKSVQRGLNALGDVEIVGVHDAARPFASAELLAAGKELLDRCDGAIPVVPIADTIKEVGSDEILLGTIDRARLRAVQTPQLFRADALRAAHAEARARPGGATDDATLLEESGYTVRAFAGEAQNFKITTAYDLRIARIIVESSTPA